MDVERGVMRKERKGKERNKEQEKGRKGNDWIKWGELIKAVAEPESHRQLSVPAMR